jgi:hypothetical protein
MKRMLRMIFGTFAGLIVLAAGLAAFGVWLQADATRLAGLPAETPLAVLGLAAVLGLTALVRRSLTRRRAAAAVAVPVAEAVTEVPEVVAECAAEEVEAAEAVAEDAEDDLMFTLPSRKALLTAAAPAPVAAPAAVTQAPEDWEAMLRVMAAMGSAPEPLAGHRSEAEADAMSDAAPQDKAADLAADAPEAGAESVVAAVAEAGAEVADLDAPEAIAVADEEMAPAETTKAVAELAAAEDEPVADGIGNLDLVTCGPGIVPDEGPAFAENGVAPALAGADEAALLVEEAQASADIAGTVEMEAVAQCDAEGFADEAAAVADAVGLAETDTAKDPVAQFDTETVADGAEAVAADLIEAEAMQDLAEPVASLADAGGHIEAEAVAAVAVAAQEPEFPEPKEDIAATLAGLIAAAGPAAVAEAPPVAEAPKVEAPVVEAQAAAPARARRFSLGWLLPKRKAARAQARVKAPVAPVIVADVGAAPAAPAQAAPQARDTARGFSLSSLLPRRKPVVTDGPDPLLDRLAAIVAAERQREAMRRLHPAE